MFFSRKILPALFNKEMALDLPKDAHIIVMAYDNAKPTGRRQTIPMALSNPIFVDVDGFMPNKDMLGKTLPVPKSDKPSTSEP